MFDFHRARALSATLGFLLIVTPGRGSAQHFPPDDRLAVMLRYLVEDAGVPGVVLAVREADGSTRVLSSGSGGEGARPLSDRSIFEIGSITKTFTGALLAQMVLRGEVGLDDPVARYLPSGVEVPSRDGQEITLLDLATHRSGLPLWGRHVDEPPDPRDPWAGYTVESMYRFLAGHELERVPGTEYHYSNLGFGLLGHVLARVAGTTYPELLRSRILEPLGMESTRYEIPDSLASWMTVGQESNATVAVESDARRGAGGLFSTASDMTKWLDLALGVPESDLGRAMELAQQPRILRDAPGRTIGLGWWTDSISGRPSVWHGGRRAGYMANISLDRETNVGAVMLWNTERHQDGLASVLVTLPPPPVPWRGMTTAADLSEFVGAYRRDTGAWAFIGTDQGHLTYQPPGLVRARLYPNSDSTFYMLRGPWTVTFDRDADGSVSGMRMAIDEREPGMSTVLEFAPTDEAVPTPQSVYRRDFPGANAGEMPWAILLTLLFAGGLGAAYVVRRRRARRF